MQDRSIRKLPGWRATLAAALTSLTAVVVLVACGGGGGAGDTGAPTTGTPSGATSYTLGTISGFGSVVVGGVRFDDSNATVEDEDGNAFRSSDLKLGMRVQLD